MALPGGIGPCASACRLSISFAQQGTGIVQGGLGQRGSAEHVGQLFYPLLLPEQADVAYYYKANHTRIGRYDIQYFTNGEWKTLDIEQQSEFERMHRCPEGIRASKVRVTFHDYDKGLAIAELLVY